MVESSENMPEDLSKHQIRQHFGPMIHCLLGVGLNISSKVKDKKTIFQILNRGPESLIEG